MHGDHSLSPQSRLLFAAIAFAVFALIALGAVWMWPIWFADPVAEAPGELTDEEREQIRSDLRESMRIQAEMGSSVTPEEKETIRNTLTEQAAAESDLQEEEKEDIRAQLRAQMQQ